MKKKRRNVTLQTEEKLSDIISTVVFLVVFIIIMVKVDFIHYCFMEAPVLTLVIIATFSLLVSWIAYELIYEIIFKGSERKEMEERQKSKEEVEKLLAREELTEVFFLEPSGDMEKMVKTILHKEGIKYFAKLGKKDEIELIVKNKNEEEIYKTKIIDYVFYLKNFR